MLGILRRVFSFADWDQHNPAKPPPGDMLDASFDAHANRIHELDQLVSTLVRPDGQLANHIVDRDSLKPALFRDFHQEIEDSVQKIDERVLNLAREAQLARDSAVLASQDAIQHVSRAESVKNDLETAELRTSDRISALNEKSDQVSRLLATEIETRTDWDDASSAAQAWADSSRLWAEHMPDTLPDNALKVMDVTGDHWSSRWWANQAANAFGMLTSLYLGAHPVPPATNANGGPIQIGSIYYDTTTGQAMVWDGAQWQSFYGVQRAGILTLWYNATAGQTVFNLGVPDLNGLTYTLDVGTPEGLDVHVNGLKAMPDPPSAGRWTVDYSDNAITFKAPGLVAGDKVGIDVLVPNEALGPGDVFNWALKPLEGVDGVKVTFSLECASVDGPLVTVNRDEELLVSVDGVIQQPSQAYTSSGDTITFMTAPAADSLVFIVWMRSDGGTGLPAARDTPDEILEKLKDVDGAGSGLDADLLDGQHGAYYATDADMTAAENAIVLKAPIASPVFTGDPKAPTPTAGDSDTSIATTAFVTGAITTQNTAMTTADALRVLKAGDTMTGNLTFTGANTAIVLNKAASGGVNVVYGQTNALMRWAMQFGSGAAESTGDAGSNFAIYRYNDAGTVNATAALSIDRAAGNTALSGNITIGGTGRYKTSTAGWMGACGTAGTMYFRPNGENSSTGEVSIDTGGNLYTAGGTSFAGGITFNGNLNGTTANLLLGAGDGGAIYLRPNGYASGTGQGIFDTAGNFSLPGQISSGSTYGGVGYRCRPGISGGYDDNWFNWYWNGYLDVYVDASAFRMLTPCDYRTKANVEDLPGSFWERTKALRPIKYNDSDWMPEWELEKADKRPMFRAGAEERWGFLAHELQETLIPDAASGHKDIQGEIQVPNLMAVVAALTKALQEAMQRIEVLESKVP